MGIVDQGVVSASNFIVTLVLARKLAVSDYGLYVMVFGLILALNSIQNSLIVIPFTIRYANADLPAWRSAVIRCLTINLATASIQIPIVAAACIYLGQPYLATPAVLALCLWQAQDTVRRALFQRCLFLQALIGDSVRYGLPALAVIALPREALSARFFLMVIAAASGIAPLFCLGSFAMKGDENLSWGRIRREVQDSWTIGRSIILYNVLATALSQGCVWILGNMDGLGSASRYQAINNIMGVTNPALLGNAVVQEPAVARTYMRSGARAAIVSALPYAAVVAGLTFPLLTFFALAPGWTLARFYGKASPYAMLSLPMRIAAIGQILTVGFLLACSILNSLRRSELFFRVQMITSAIGLAIMFPAVRWGGLSGCLIALAAVYLFRMSAVIWKLRAAYRENPFYYESRPPEIINV